MPSFVIDYFELPSTDMAASRRFLDEAFGFGLKDYGPSYAEIIEAGVLGGLIDGGDRRAAPMIGIRTDDIAAAQRAVEAAGGTITKPVYDYPGGQRFYFREPGGNELLVYSPGE